MGVLSSIFGERPAAPQTGGFTVGAEIPKELAPFYKDILGKSQALYNESVARGYEPYTGPSLAEFTPEQQQAFTGIAGLQGQQAPIYQEAMGMTRDAAAPITTEQIEEYMNPYQQAVVDIEKREAQKQYESQVVPQLAAKAAMAQPFGGSRQAILEGMAADTQQRLLGDIQAKGSAQAYQDAVNLLQNQRDRLGSGAGQLATLGANQFKSQLGEIGALQTVGEEKQQLAQQALNEAYGQYVKEQEFPFQQLGRYQSVVTGAPIQQTQYVPPTPPGPSVGQQLLGGAATMLGTYGAFGGKMPQLFNQAPAKTGGGIADLPVIKAQDGTGIGDRLKNIAFPPRYLYNKLFTKGYAYPSMKKKVQDEIEKRERFRNNSTYNFMDPLPEDYEETVDEFGRSADAREKYLRQRNKILRDEKINTIDSLTRMSPPPDNVYQDDSGLEVYKEILMKKRPDLNVPVKSEDKDTGILSIIKNKYQDIKTNRRDNQKEIAEKYKKLLEERDINPFLDKNKPPMLADKTDVRPDSPFVQDLNKLKEMGYEFIGDTADIIEKGRNFYARNVNKLINIGENYFLKPGEKLDRLPIVEEGTGRKNLREGKRLPPINVAESDEEGAARIRALSSDKRPGFNEGLIVEAERILENPEIITESNAVDTLKKFYLKASEITGAYPSLNNKKAEEKTENLLERPVPPKQLKNLNEKPVKTITAINNNDTSLNKSITKNEDKVVETASGYGKLITKKDKGDKVSKTDLASAQDKYLEAVKKMNEGLDKKDALIGKAQQESFWAFVARVGANISKGAGISESVAAELPQAMQDRKSLIQAKSDLEDKKLAGKVDLAKAGLDVEKSRTAARIAKEAEIQRRKEKGKDQFIDWIGAVNKNKGKTIPYKLSSESSIDLHGPMVADTISKALEVGDTRFNAPTILNEEGVAYTGKDLASNIKKISKQKDFQAAVLSTFEQISLQYAEDGIVKNMDELLVEATNKVMNNLPTKYKKKSSSFWASF